MIITESSIFCPHCGLRLNINHQESQPAIEALKKFQQAQSDFDRGNRSMLAALQKKDWKAFARLTRRTFLPVEVSAIYASLGEP